MKKQPVKQRGQSLVEYVALTALVAIVSIGTVKVFGGKVRTRLNQITNAFDKNIQNGLKSRLHVEDEDDDGDEIRFPRGIRLPGGIRLPRNLPIPSGF